MILLPIILDKCECQQIYQYLLLPFNDELEMVAFFCQFGATGSFFKIIIVGILAKYF